MSQPTSPTLKVAFWPDEKKIGCAKIQRQFNCDPRIAGMFPTDMVTMQILNSPIYIWEATEAEWRKMAKAWTVIDHRDKLKRTKSLVTH